MKNSTMLMVAAIMILFGSIVASQALEKQNPTGPEGGGVSGQPTTTVPKKPTTTAPLKKSDLCSLPTYQCPPGAQSCTTTSACCTAPAGNQKCGIVQTSTPASCLRGYYGRDCVKCGCGPNGTCSEGILGSGACSCNVNYYGANCVYCLAATTCNGNGVCSYNGCTCNAGYSGATCETKTP